MTRKEILNLALTSIIISGAFVACGGGEEQTSTTHHSTMIQQKAKPKVKPTSKPIKEDPMSNTGVGPIKELTLPADIDESMAAEGKKVYKAKCTACHKVSKRFIGPSPRGIFKRRNPAWVMNMILNPGKMVKEDPIAIALLKEYSAPMANQGLTEKEARAIVEYFRTLPE